MPTDVSPLPRGPETDEVLRRVGRNVVNFQYIVEHLLKRLTAAAVPTGPASTMTARVEKHSATVNASTMGTLALTVESLPSFTTPAGRWRRRRIPAAERDAPFQSLLTQFSTTRPAYPAKSASLFVTSGTPRATACDAMSLSRASGFRSMVAARIGP